MSVTVMDGRPGPACGARSRTRIELDPFHHPPFNAGQMHESASMGSDIQEPPRSRGNARIELSEDMLKNEVLAARVKLGLNPGFGPPLVVHTVEETIQRRQPFRLSEATPGTPDEPDALATVGVQLGILSDILVKVQSALMEALEIGAAADPTPIDGRKHQTVSARSTRVTIS
jgi:hypothetical protein